jgi:carboxymethylenebutenolidase
MREVTATTKGRPALTQPIQLTASDGHHPTAYIAAPRTKPLGSLVVLQELFGVNSHIRQTCDRFAAEGYHVIAPALFDRVAPGVELGYGDSDVAEGRQLRAKLTWDNLLADTKAAIDAARPFGRVGVVGYCLGGSIAWRAAAKLSDVTAAVCYYGGQIPNLLDDTPACPVLMHFGELDTSIPPDAVEKIRAAKFSLATIYSYPEAGHGFSCDARSAFDEPSHLLAYRRTLNFLKAHLA